MKIWKKRVGRGQKTEQTGGERCWWVDPPSAARFNSETTPGPGGRFRPVRAGFPLQLSENDIKKHRLMVIEHCFRLFIAPAGPPSSAPPAPAPRGPGHAAAVIRGRVRALYGPVTRRAAQHFHFSPIAFYVFSLAPGLVWYNQTRIAKGRIDDAPI